MGIRRGNLTKDIGATGLNESWGVIKDDFLAEWRGREKAKRIDEMLKNSPVVAALRMAIEMPIRDISWRFASDAGEDDPRLELLNAAWDNMTHSWNDHISEALLSVFYGWSMFTITYERIDGRMLWRKFKMLGHDTVHKWLFANDGGLAGLQQLPHLWPEPLPIERMLIYRFRRPMNNPEGESILRPAWPAWYYIKNIQQIEAIGIERDLAGLPMIELPEHADATESTSDTTDYGRATKIVRNVRNDEQAGIVLPAGWKFALVASGGSRQIDTDRVISRYEKRMLMASLAEFIMLGMDNVGALSTSKDKTDFFVMVVNSIADMIAETFTKFAISRLLEINGMDADGIVLEHGTAGDVDMAVVADFLQKTGALITWTAQDEAWLRSLARLPEIDADELDQMRQEKEARAAAQAQALAQLAGQRRNDSGGNNSQDNDMMRAELFAAGNAPDDDQRRTFEGQWQRKMQTFFRRQQERIMAAVRRE